jgi:hypothetical protein
VTGPRELLRLRLRRFACSRGSAGVCARGRDCCCAPAHAVRPPSAQKNYLQQDFLQGFFVCGLRSAGRSLADKRVCGSALSVASCGLVDLQEFFNPIPINPLWSI